MRPRAGAQAAWRDGARPGRAGERGRGRDVRGSHHHSRLPQQFRLTLSRAEDVVNLQQPLRSHPGALRLWKELYDDEHGSLETPIKQEF